MTLIKGNGQGFYSRVGKPSANICCSGGTRHYGAVYHLPQRQGTFAQHCSTRRQSTRLRRTQATLASPEADAINLGCFGCAR